MAEVVKFAEIKLKNAPDGTLYVKNKRYYVRNGNSAKEIYLGKNKDSLIKDLQEKVYYKELLDAAKTEIMILNKIKKCKSNCRYFEQVFYELPENKRNLIEPYTSPEMIDIKKKIDRARRIWDEDSKDRKSVGKNLNFITLNGERVRSKSELIIADRLKVAGIPYCYEGKYLLADEEAQDYQVWFPDFQMFNVRTGKMFYWEHFGLMDNPDYCASCQTKLEIYAQSGISLGKNLIITMESSKHPLNVAYVDSLIKTILE